MTSLFEYEQAQAIKRFVDAQGRWYWRAVGLLVAASTVTMAVFSALTYLSRP